MPPVNLPQVLEEVAQNIKSGKVDSPDGPGVAAIETPDKRVRADIFVGLILDGLKLYENISAVEPTIKMQFAVNPVVNCTEDVVDFDPDEDKLLSIKVCARWANKH